MTPVEPETVESDAGAETAAGVRAWLAGGPDAAELASNPATVELALGLGEGFETLARAGRAAELAAMPSAALAAWIRLNLTAWQLGGGDEFRSAAAKGLAEARARFDEDLEYFRTANAEGDGVFSTEANASLAEVFYFAWRALDDQSLRPLAGTALGAVGERGDPEAGLFERAELPEGRGSEPDRAGTYAAAIQMYLTASETTARGTYVSRAAIAADMWEARRPNGGESEKRVELARALVRLGQFMAGPYRERALELLNEMKEAGAPEGTRAVGCALARQEARAFPMHVVVIGDVANDETARRMWQQALEMCPPARAIEALDPARHASRIAALGYEPFPGKAVAYVCAGTVCLPPLFDVERLGGALRAIAQAASARVTNEEER